MSFTLVIPRRGDPALDALAETTGAPVTPHCDEHGHAVQVFRHDGRLALGAAVDGQFTYVQVDWRSPRVGLTRRTSLLARAVGGDRGALVIDTTAGLGRDAHELFSLGYRVLACERHPVLAAMLREAQADAAVEVREGDAARLLHDWPRSDAPHAIYLDPMFPPRGKSAQVKKEARLLQRLLHDGLPADRDIGAVFAAAWSRASRVVVKRPQHAPALAAGVNFAVAGRAVRCDVYLTLNRALPSTTTP